MTRITELKSENIHQIRSCFYEGTIWTKNKLAKQTGLSLVATTNILQILVNAREIKQIGEAKSTGGRKSKQYLVNKDYCHFGQIILKRDDVNHYFIIKSYDLLKQKLTDRQVISKQGTILELLDIIKELIKIDNKIKLLTLSVPGVCQNGKINICDFDQFVNIDLKKLIKEKYDLDVVMGNDVNVASIGFAKRYPKVNNIVLMYQPKVKYIGCGIIINQQLLTGYSNFAGELSYLPFISFDEQDQLLKKIPMIY